MLIFFEALLVIVSFLLFTKFTMKIWFPRKLDDTDDIRTTYVIRFKNEVPDISMNDALMEKMNIVRKISQGYVVQSRINDVALKASLAEQYHMKLSEIDVHSRMFMNFVL